jgi:GntR family transcriptional regulator, transcriptional repressor for pyruvate dehydrogenase complex
MSLADQAVVRLRQLIQTGKLQPGARLPPEQQLAMDLSISRNGVREAVRALVVARVLEIRRGEGTFVTSLEPALLLEGVGVAVDLLQGDTVLEVTEVRRLIEPVATALAATRISAAQLATVRDHLEAMREEADDPEVLNQHDAAFHNAVIAATGNRTLATLLAGIASQTLRARVWRGLVDDNAASRTLAEHEAIYDALAAGDAPMAKAAALTHIGTTERWLRAHLAGEAQ